VTDIIGLTELVPVLIFAAIVLGVFALLSLVAERHSRVQERLRRYMNPAAAVEKDRDRGASEALKGLLEKASAFSKPLMPQSELERSKLRLRLAHAGFRSEHAAAIFLGLKMIFLLIGVVLGLALFGLKYGFTFKALQFVVILGGCGYFLPEILLWWMIRKRQQAIFLTLPDALDLMVVCVESGLGLDAAMRKVCEEMKAHAPVICEELALANLQLQMGRPRREVLHDLGVRTGVDDMRSLAAILIQADRFGSSIAQALRVQSDSMRTRRRQLAEEKAAKTAVQLIFPLVLFIFPGIFVVLVGPAAINIANNMLK